MFPEHLATSENSVLNMQTAMSILVKNIIDIPHNEILQLA